jgi:hypothetical protein
MAEHVLRTSRPHDRLVPTTATDNIPRQSYPTQSPHLPVSQLLNLLDIFSWGNDAQKIRVAYQ